MDYNLFFSIITSIIFVLFAGYLIYEQVYLPTLETPTPETTTPPTLMPETITQPLSLTPIPETTTSPPPPTPIPETITSPPPPTQTPETTTSASKIEQFTAYDPINMKFF